MAKVTKISVTARLQILRAACVEYCTNRTMVLNRVPMKATAVVQKLDDQLTALAEVTTTNKAWQQAVAGQRSQYASEIVPLIAQLHAYVLNTFGADSVEYAAFGFAPPRKPTLTVNAKAKAVAQMQATRVARNVMGRKQRKAIRGVVTSSSPASSSPASSSPAANASASVNGSVGTTTKPSSPNGNGTPA